MSADTHHGSADLAIIGGGAAGVLVALQALSQARGPLRIRLFEPASTLAEGIAYATPSPVHLLNVPVARMSAFPDQPLDFQEYLQDVAAYPHDDAATLPGRFASRRHYAPYLRQRLATLAASSTASLEVTHQAVLAVQRTASGLRLTLADGSVCDARQMVLACGNTPRPMPLAGADAIESTRLAEAWDHEGVRLLGGGQVVGIVGSGLSMVDSVLTLLETGHDGVIHAFSRHGLLPLPHAHGAPATFDPAPLLAMPLRQRMRALRLHVREAAASGIPWQSVMERIRPLGQALWTSLDAADQRRFLRHVVRYWDVHRHRIAAEVHARLQAAIGARQLQLHRARLQGVVEDGAGLRVSAQVDGTASHWRVDALVNATGIETRTSALRNPLLRHLLAHGMARSGPHGLGLDTRAGDGCLLDADGNADAAIGVIGTLRIGTLWETIAVPELRQQAAGVVHHALDELQRPMP